MKCERASAVRRPAPAISTFPSGRGWTFVYLFPGEQNLAAANFDVRKAVRKTDVQNV